MSILLLQNDSAPPVPVWPPPPRAPLPPFPTPTETQPDGPYASAWTHDAFLTPLPFTPPSQPDLDFHRGNFCGLRVPGAPWVPGGCDPDPSLIMTWFEYLYPPEWQATILRTYQQAGYTHLDYHRAAWMGLLNDGSVPRCSMQQACDSVKRAIDAGIPYPIVNLAIDAHPDPREMEPWIKALAAAGMTIGCEVATHWVLPGCAVYDEATCAKYGVCDRFSFQRFVSNLGIRFTYMQQDVNAPILDVRPREGGLLGEIQDTLRSMTDYQCLVISEYDAQAEFDAPRERLEIFGDLKGRAMLTATTNGRTISGYLNGARNVDGSVL